MSDERTSLSMTEIKALAQKLSDSISYKPNVTPDTVAVLVADEGMRRGLDPFDAIRLAAWAAVLYDRNYTNMGIKAR